MANASQRECHRCGRQFARLEHLQRHERSHTKEKPYGCSVCTKAFTRKDLLTRHNRIYHDQNPSGRARDNRPVLSTGTIVAQTSPQLTNSSALETIGNTSLSVQSSDGTEFRHISLHNQLSATSFTNLQDANVWAPELEFSDFSTTYVGDEFSNFVDTIGFPSNPFSPSYQPVPDWPSEPPFTSQSEVSETQQTRQDGAEAGIDELDIEATPWASYMPSVQPQDQQGGLSMTSKRPMLHALAQVGQKCRECMIEKLKAYSAIVPTDFILPSRHTLTCFMTGYVTIFNEHYPLIHIPTLKLETLSVELFLSIAALGAQYYWERTKGLELFHVARAVTYERLRGHALSNSRAKLENWEVLQAAQALILLIAVSTWSEAGKGEAFALRSLLEEVMHADAFNIKGPVRSDSWDQWKHHEEVKRTKLIAYCFFNLHTITFDVPPMMLYRDVDAGLACSERLWRADTADSWYNLMTVEKAEVSFSGAFQTLFEAPQEITNHNGAQSPLSGHTLLQAIIQHIWLLQQAGNLPIRHSLASTEAAHSVEVALKRWRMCWETEHESSADTSGSDGPMPFTSRALLRLAYIRINIDSGSSRSIGTWNPHEIARSLRRHPSVQRNDKMTRAALHCAQGLGIPIKLGINFVAHTQVFYWSNQYALCSLECALLLTKWLEAVVIPNPVPELTEKEHKLLDFVVQLVNHTEYEDSRERLLQNNKHLSIIVLRLWAILFRPGVWDIVDLIGKSLLAYAELLEHEEDSGP